MKKNLDAIIPVYKPIGLSTFDLIRIIKKETKIKTKIGHGGTLDPFASGVVLLLIGKATKKFEEIKKWEKTYLTSLRFGYSSSTLDIEGKIEKKKCVKKPKEEEIRKILSSFIGLIKQKVPYFSASKYKGVPLYKLARKNKFIEKFKKVKVKNIEMVVYKWPILTLRITTSGGVYIRSLGEEIGKKLKCSTFLFFLEREKVGEYKKEKAFSLKEAIEKIKLNF